MNNTILNKQRRCKEGQPLQRDVRWGEHYVKNPLPFLIYMLYMFVCWAGISAMAIQSTAGDNAAASHQVLEGGCHAHEVGHHVQQHICQTWGTLVKILSWKYHRLSDLYLYKP